MNNTERIFEFYAEISDDELKDIVSEIKESEKSGVIGPLVEKYICLSAQITGKPQSTIQFILGQIYFIREAAFRWAAKKPDNPLNPQSVIYKGETFFDKQLVLLKGHYAGYKSHMDVIVGQIFFSGQEEARVKILNISPDDTEQTNQMPLECWDIVKPLISTPYA